MWKIAAICLFSAAPACHAERPAPLVNDAPTLAILGDDGVICGAVAVAPTLAITANHCVPEREVAFVTASRSGEPDRTAHGTVISRDAASDLALISSDGLVPAELAPPVIDYEHATTVVSHIPSPWSVTTLRPVDERDGFVQTPRLESGMSGSGLWDDGGRLVGIAVGNDQKLGYFAGRERLQHLMQGLPAAAAVSDATGPAALWGDPNLRVDDLLARAKARRDHIEAGLGRLAHER
jgi:hypothetical protein